MNDMKKQQFLQVDYQTSAKLSQSEIRVLETWLSHASRVVQSLFTDSKIKKVRVSLLICGDSMIKKLNVEHRNKNKVTDVLSFPAHESLRKKIGPDQLNQGELFLGDLAICFPQTKRQAKQYSIGLWDEFIHLFFHGVLHLMGYDHEISAKEEKLMQGLEDKCIESFSKIKKGT